MKSLYQNYKTDNTAESTGVWFPLDETEDGQPIRIKIKRAGGSNADFQKTSAKIMKPYQVAINNGGLSDQKMADLLAEIYAKSVLVGWENIADENGIPMDFTVDNAVKLLTDLPDLLEKIMVFATDMKTFRSANVEEAVKNLPAS